MELLYKRDKTPEDVEKLVYVHKNLVYYCLSQTGQLNNQDAESAAFEALWDSVNLFDVYSTTAFSTFACTVIKNRILTVLRDSKKLRTTEVPLKDTMLSTHDTCEQPNNRNYNRLCRQIDNYINCQTDKINAILTYWRSKCYNVSAAKIAEQCNVSPSYVSRVQLSFKVAVQGFTKANKNFDKD